MKLSALKELIPFAAREVIDSEKINGESLLTSLTFCSNKKWKKIKKINYFQEKDSILLTSIYFWDSI